MSNPNNTGSLDVLKKAFNEGYEAFNTVKPNARGFVHNPTNTYPPKSLPFKEFQRGYDRAFTDNQKRGVV